MSYNDLLEALPYIKSIGIVSDLSNVILTDSNLGSPEDFLGKEDRTIYLMFLDGKDICFAYVSVEAFTKLFSNILLYNGKSCVATQDSKYKIPIPIESKLGQLVYNEHDIRKIKCELDRSYDFIPDGLRNKYCLCFANKVFDHVDTFEEAKLLASTKYPQLAMIIYEPKQ